MMTFTIIIINLGTCKSRKRARIVREGRVETQECLAGETSCNRELKGTSQPRWARKLYQSGFQ